MGRPVLFARGNSRDRFSTDGAALRGKPSLFFQGETLQKPGAAPDRAMVEAMAVEFFSRAGAGRKNDPSPGERIV